MHGNFCPCSDLRVVGLHLKVNQQLDFLTDSIINLSNETTVYTAVENAMSKLFHQT